MSGSGTNVGSVEVTIDGDAKPVVDSFNKASEKVDDFEDKLKKTSDAAAKVSSRVDELRTKQEQLVRALVEAANAADRDEAKVHALRNELEATTGSLNRLTNAQQASVGAQQKLHYASTSAAASSRNLGGAVLEASRAFEDMQYGIAGVLNNIPSLVMQLGGTMGLAGVISLVLVAATQMTKLWPDFGAAAKTAIATAAEEAKTLRGEVKGLEEDLLRLRIGADRAALQIQGQIVVAAAEAAAPGLEKVGGRERFDRLAQYEANGTNIDGVTAMPELEWRALKLAVAKADDELAKLANIKRIQDEQAAQNKADDAVDAANAAEAAFQADQKKAAASAAKDLTPMQEFTALQEMFADIKAAGTKSTASWANPTITPEGANVLAGMDVEGAILEISTAANATADEIAAMNADFAAAGTAAIDLRSPLERFGDALEDMRFDQALAGAAGMAASGNLSGAGSLVGGVGGAAVGTAVLPGIGGMIGGALGSAVGGIFGTFLEDLVEQLGVLAPVFDALGLVVGALAPIFMVVGVLFEAISGVIVSLVPIIAALAEPIAAIALLIVRGFQAGLPFVSMLLMGVGALVQWLEVITIGAQWLDQKVYAPLASGAAHVFNGFVDLYNSIIYLVRRIPGFEDFGVTMEGMSTYVEDTIGNFATSLDGVRDVMGETAKETANAGRSMANIPSWYRVPLAEYGVAGGRSGAASGGASGGGAWGNAGPWQGQQFNGPVTFVMTSPSIADAVRRDLMKKTGVAVVRRNNDESN